MSLWDYIFIGLTIYSLVNGYLGRPLLILLLCHDSPGFGILLLVLTGALDTSTKAKAKQRRKKKDTATPKPVTAPKKTKSVPVKSTTPSDNDLPDGFNQT